MPFLYITAVLWILFSVANLLLQIYYLCCWCKSFSKEKVLSHLNKVSREWENYIKMPLFMACIIFVFPVGHEDWCYPKWRWAFGAVSLFLAWLNSITVLIDLPWLGIGQTIKMLYNVYSKFIELIYLPILLVLTFGFTFYMVLIYNGTSFEVGIIKLLHCVCF